MEFKNKWKATELGKSRKHINRVESKQEQADQNQNTPKLEDTKKSKENRKDTSELSECNVGKLGELNQNSLKPYHSKVKSKNLSEVKIKNQSSHQYRNK